MKVLIFGDSITWGSDDCEKGGWVERLKTNSFGESQDVDIYNLGISGDTTEGLLKRFKSEALTRSRKLEAIIFAIGINDSQFEKEESVPKIALDIFRRNIAELAQQAREFTSNITFVGLTQVVEAKTRPTSWGIHYSNGSVESYNSVLQEFCTSENIHFISMQNVLNDGDLPDGLHPNAEGHRKMYEKVKSEFVLRQN